MQTKGEKVRADIVAAANQLFYRKGFRATSFADIAVDAGIPKGNFYFHFKTKDALLDAVIDDRLGRLQAQLETWRNDIADPRERLRRAVRMIENDQSNLLEYGCPIGTLIAELIKTHARQKAHLAKMLDLIEAWMTEQIEQLSYEPANARQIARRFVRNMQGAAVLIAAYGQPDVIAQTVREIDREIDGL